MNTCSPTTLVNIYTLVPPITGTLVKLTQCIHLHKKNKAHYLRIYIIRWPVLYVLSNGFFKVGYRLPVVTLAHEEAANINFQASSSRSNRVDNLLNGYCTLIAVSKWQLRRAQRSVHYVKNNQAKFYTHRLLSHSFKISYA